MSANTIHRQGGPSGLVTWVGDQGVVAYDLWAKCPRGDWLAWMLGKEAQLLASLHEVCLRAARTSSPDVARVTWRVLAETGRGLEAGLDNECRRSLRRALETAPEEAASLRTQALLSADLGGMAAAEAAEAAYWLAVWALYGGREAAMHAVAHAAKACSAGLEDETAELAALGESADVIRRLVPWSQAAPAMKETLWAR